MPLRLLAEDAADLQVISAAMQDAVGVVGDIVWDARARTLTLAFNRYRWEARSRRGGGERVRSALQIGSVLAVRSRGLRLGAGDAVVSLLALAWEPGEAPGGSVVLTLAGDGEVRAEVEALDLALADVGEPWPTPRTPRH